MTLQKVVGSLKRGEKSKIEVMANFLQENDPDLKERLEKASVPDDDKFDPSKNIFVQAELLRLVKVEDWFKDDTTIVRTLRKGKGRSPYIDSTVSFRLQVTVDEDQLVSNYPE